MKTQPSKSELETEQLRNIELRLTKFHVDDKSVDTQIAKKIEEDQARKERIKYYEQRDNEIYARLLRVEEELGVTI